MKERQELDPKYREHFRYKHGYFPKGPGTSLANDIVGLGIMAGRVHAGLPQEDLKEAGIKFQRSLKSFRERYNVTCRTPETDYILEHNEFIPENCRIAANQAVVCLLMGAEIGQPITVGAYLAPEKWLPPEELAKLKITERPGKSTYDLSQEECDREIDRGWMAFTKDVD